MAQFTVIVGTDPDLLGKQFILSDSDTIGSSPSDSIVIKSKDILPQHAKIKITGKNVQLSVPHSDAMVMINGEIVESSLLGHGDIVIIGDYTLMFDDETTNKAPGKTGRGHRPLTDLLATKILRQY